MSVLASNEQIRGTLRPARRLAAPTWEGPDLRYTKAAAELLYRRALQVTGGVYYEGVLDERPVRWSTLYRLPKLRQLGTDDAPDRVLGIGILLEQADTPWVAYDARMNRSHADAALAEASTAERICHMLSIYAQTACGSGWMLDPDDSDDPVRKVVWGANPLHVTTDKLAAALDHIIERGIF